MKKTVPGEIGAFTFWSPNHNNVIGQLQCESWANIIVTIQEQHQHRDIRCTKSPLYKLEYV